MNTTKLLTMLVAALVVSAGAGAVTAAQADAETSVEANYDEGAVTVTVTQNGSAAENVSVAANGAPVGTTDANGTLTFETNASEELTLAFEGDGIDLERTYEIDDGELEIADEEDESDEEDDESTLSANVSYDNGTVDVTVTENDSAVANATVEANDEEVGTTDANGTLTFETNATEELDLQITSGEQELELEYTIENGELVAESDDDESDEEKGPDENASERAHTVFGIVQEWLNGDSEGNLGQMIQDAIGNSDNASDEEAPGNSGDAGPNSSEAAPGNSDAAPGNSDNSDRGNGNAPVGDEADDTEDVESEEDDAEEDDEDDEEEEEEEEDDDENPGNGKN